MLILRFVLLAIFFSAYLYIPGLVLTTFIKKIENYYKPLIALAFCLLFSYVNLYLYLYKSPVAHVMSVAYLGLFVLSVGALIVHKGIRGRVTQPQILLPIFFALSVCLFYNFLAFNRKIDQQPLIQSQYVIYRMPDDNILPFYFTNQILQQNTQLADGTWLFSDRPPLQTGVMLTTDIISRPKTAITTINQEYTYQVIASLLQCSWVLGLWAICKQLGLKNKQIVFVFLLAIFSGFMFLNSVFVWPKLLSAALFLGGIAIWLKPKITQWEAVLSGGLIGLSLLSHTGAAFSVPILIILLARRSRFHKRQIILCIAAIILLMVPWSGFVHAKNPPGNRLIKMHLAGDPNADSSSFTQALRYDYSHQTLHKTIDNKLSNFTTVFHMPLTWDNHGLQEADFRYTFWSLGLLNLGWWAYFANFRKRKNTQDINLLLTGTLVSLGLWCLLMFSPDAALIHAGSYVNNLLLIGCLGVLISFYKRVWLKYLVILVAAIHFFITWVILPNSTWPVSPPAVVASIASLLLCLLVLYAIYKSKDTKHIVTRQR